MTAVFASACEAARVGDQRKSSSSQNDNREQENDTEREPDDREQAGHVRSAGHHGFPVLPRLVVFGQLSQRTRVALVPKAWARAVVGGVNWPPASAEA